ncbi:Uncharacterised protein [Nocardia cyriacigeorgica]|uniref:Uncharacterized protein n=3 Tax=Nocardia cyriacigeorgica TaxID=135487 RepID=A0A4U8W5I4_9NOCA|nr:Uncharacterised protein [Nocardia cyriacigeorgica]
MIATKPNRSGVTSVFEQRCSPARAARSPVVIGRPGRLLDSIAAEFRRHGVVSSYGGAPHVSRRMSRLPHLDGQRDGPDPSALGDASRPDEPSDASRPSAANTATGPSTATGPRAAIESRATTGLGTATGPSAATESGAKTEPRATTATSAPNPRRPTELTATSPATIVIVDRSMIEFLFRDRTRSPGVVRMFDRIRRERSVERRLCEMATTSALAIAARRLLIVCEIGQTSADERTRALRWVRGSAHRIGYECSVNGLHGLATWYTVVVSGTDRAHAARSVVEWYRSGHLP